MKVRFVITTKLNKKGEPSIEVWKFDDFGKHQSSLDEIPAVAKPCDCCCDGSGDDKYITSASYDNGVLTIVQNGVPTDIQVSIPTGNITGSLPEYVSVEAASSDINLPLYSFWVAADNNLMGLPRGVVFQKNS